MYLLVTSYIKHAYLKQCGCMYWGDKNYKCYTHNWKCTTAITVTHRIFDEFLTKISHTCKILRILAIAHREAFIMILLLHLKNDNPFLNQNKVLFCLTLCSSDHHKCVNAISCAWIYCMLTEFCYLFQEISSSFIIKIVSTYIATVCSKVYCYHLSQL